MSDIVIYCPNKAHKIPVVKLVEGKRIEEVPNPKILFVCARGSVGKFKVQCADRRCRKSTKGNGWFEIRINGTGGFSVKELPKKWHQMKPSPYILED
jgi:hypothetical protein